MPVQILQPAGQLSPSSEQPSLRSFLPGGEPMFDMNTIFNDYKFGDRLLYGSQRSLECLGRLVYDVYPQQYTFTTDSSDKDRQEQWTDEERIECIIRRTSEYQDQIDVVHARMAPAIWRASSLTLEERVTQLTDRIAVYNSQEAAMQGARQYKYLSDAKSNSNAQSVKDKAASINSPYENPLVLSTQPGPSYAAVSGSPSVSLLTRQWNKNQAISQVPVDVCPALLPTNSSVKIPAKRNTTHLHRVPATRELRLQAFNQPDKALPTLPQQLEVTALTPANVTMVSNQPPSTTADVRSTPPVGSAADFARQEPRDIHVLIDRLEEIVTSSGAKLSNYLRPIVMRLEPAMIQQLRDSRLYLEIEPSSPLSRKRQCLGSIGVAARISLSASARSTTSKKGSLSISADATSNEALHAMIPKPGVLFLDLFRAVLTAQYVIEILQEKESKESNVYNAPDRECTALGLDRLPSSQDSFEVSQHPVSLFKSATGIIVRYRSKLRYGKGNKSSSTVQRLESIRKGLSEMCREVMHHIWGPCNRTVRESLHAAAMDAVKVADGLATGQ